MKLKVIIFLSKIIFLEKIILFILRRNQIYSKTLRAYFKKVRNIEVGTFSYGCFTKDIPNGTIIGNYCSFADGIKIFNGNHGIDWATTHPFLYNTTLGLVEKETINRYKLVVGHDVWIGGNVIILPSVTKIGNGAIIGAGSVVTKNVEPYSIVAGNPATHKRFRFEREYIDILEEKKVYNLTKAEFIKNMDKMYDINLFHKINN
ncbi:CatB-related O-acetyltransferase [Algibacter pacificus]|uniref:CatB-related O-acetyltransferase n=1 Tax=Algibacter pacificus TaxID=2599389 RepID=UPI0029394C4C|nr:CatB-related O-acetyltransferase [Algibacter pacificus]